MARLLIVDDDQHSIEQISTALQHEEHQIHAAHSSVEAIRCLRRDHFDMLLFGIKEDNTRVCTAVRTDPLRGALAVICLIPSDDLDARLSCFRAGADDCIGKPFEPAELAARVKALLRRTLHGGDNRQPQLAALDGRLVIDPLTHAVLVDGEAVKLTPLEFQLLFKLVCAAGRPCSSEQLIEAVWGYAPGTGDSALLRTQIKNLRHKLGSVDPAVAWIVTVPNVGYYIPG